MRTQSVTPLVVALALTVSLAVTGGAHAEAVTKASLMARTCYACHGTNGKGAGKIPRLKGLPLDDLTASLRGFRSGSEKSTMMGRLAQDLDDEEIRLIAEYFANMK